MAESSEADYLFKIPVVGDSDVGKTCLLLRFVDDMFPEDGQPATVDDDYKHKNLTIKNSKVKLQIWDTAGQERFRTVTSSFYRAAKGIMLVIDCTSEESLKQADHWFSDIRRNTADTAPLLLVANKIDLIDEAKRAELKERIDKWVQEKNDESTSHNLKLMFRQTSAKTGEGVNDAFECLCEAMIGRSANNQPAPTPTVRPVKRRGFCTIV